MSKTCKACKITKPLSDFYVNKATRDGVSNRCASCLNTTNRQQKLELKNGTRVKKWVAYGKNNLPKTTVFSIDPETNQPYLSYKSVENLIYKHIRIKANNIKMDKEDLAQTLLVKLVASTFNPKKAKATTFVIMVCSSKCGSIANLERNSPKVTSNSVTSEDGDVLSYTDLVVDPLTPWDYLVAECALKSESL